MKGISMGCMLIVLFTTQTACGPATTPLESLSPARPATTVPPTMMVEPTEMPTLADTRLPEPTITSPSATETSSPSRITLDVLKNFTYWIEAFNIPADLQDGVFTHDTVHGQLNEPAAFGDLNGDGLQDAAVILVIRSGGTGAFFDLIAVLDQNGTPVQSDLVYIGDRQVVNRLEIVNGRIVLDYLTQPAGGPLCCPNERRLRSYSLENGDLRLASEQVLDSPTAKATPLQNAIIIEQPLTGDQLAIPQQVSGRVSQVPPEKMLNYFVTDTNGALLLRGEAPVEGEPGGPGAFNFQFSLEAVSPGLIQVEIVDSTDGTLRGRSTVVLTAQ